MLRLGIQPIQRTALLRSMERDTLQHPDTPTDTSNNAFLFSLISLFFFGSLRASSLFIFAPFFFSHFPFFVQFFPSFPFHPDL
jgi:hypothetical protein